MYSAGLQILHPSREVHFAPSAAEVGCRYRVQPRPPKQPQAVPRTILLRCFLREPSCPSWFVVFRATGEDEAKPSHAAYMTRTAAPSMASPFTAARAWFA